MGIKFANSKHENAFYSLLTRMKKTDRYHSALAYLLTLDNVCREHISDLFDLKEDIILFAGLEKGWQTGTSLRTTRLAFNLWCTYVDDNPKNSTPDEIFCCSYTPYYFEAILLRYPEYRGGDDE